MTVDTWWQLDTPGMRRALACNLLGCWVYPGAALIRARSL